MVLKWIYINDKISNFKSSITIFTDCKSSKRTQGKNCLQQNVKDDDVDIFRLIPYLYLYPDPIPYPFYFLTFIDNVPPS